ncbi:sugar nucleotide-binding protein [Marinomonas sp. 2405UD68-3]|uniref:sugar nucleotide-binding protein n=1 Tax=Marinomonas sp. 2405UD68-3 TaxID=3391835 RepID=UPI0039C9E82D
MNCERDINAPIRVVLLGCDTVVGEELLLFSNNLSEFEWHTLSCSELLKHDYSTELLQDVGCDVIIDALSIDRSLDSRYPTFRDAVADYSAKTNTQVVMISSALVFSGDKETAYDESDLPDSQDPYSVSLSVAEKCFLSHAQNIVLRTGWLFSGKNDDFVCRTIDLIKQGANLAHNDSFVGSPSPVSDLARVTLTIIKQHYYGSTNTGVYHYCCSEEISWYGFVEAILATAGQFDAKALVSVEAINNCFPDSEDIILVKRQSLSCRRIFNHFGVKQRPWRASLRQQVKDLYQLA